jgi:hypothetical protein
MWRLDEAGEMRIGSYNVENLFARAKALNLETRAAGRPVLQAQAQLNELLQVADYDDPPVRQEILRLLVSSG